MTLPPPPPPAAVPCTRGLRISGGFEGWLAERHVSLAITTYRSNRLLLLGRAATGGLTMQVRVFDRPTGLFLEGESLWLAVRNQIWRLDNHLHPDARPGPGGADRLFVPACGTVTGDVNTHELVVPTAGPGRGQALFVNTAFSCLATLARGCSFAPRWQPPFVGQLAADDACHLNGVALRDGTPTWATACGGQGGAASWRRDLRAGGVVLHIPSDSVVATGLSMPHSPRWHQDRLWLLQSGSGEFGWIEADRFRALCPLPGFPRGLAMVGDAAVVGLSRLRSRDADLALAERLPAEGHPEGVCGLRVIDLATGAILHSLDLPAPIDELFDVVALPGVRQPRALELGGEEIDGLVRLGDRPVQVRVRPLTPRGASPQAPDLPRMGLAPPPPASAGLPSRIRFQRIFHLTPANLAPYASLTYPSLARGRPALARIRGELHGVCAMEDGAMVALAIAERRQDNGADLLSLLVAPAWRRRGIGTGLVARMMACLAAEDIHTLEVRYRATALTRAALEPILAQLRWSAPQDALVVLEGHASRLAALDWADRHPITPPYAVVPWGDLSAAQGQLAAALLAPAEPLPPRPRPSPQPDPQLSLALLHDQQPVGWLLVEATGPDAVRYSSLYVMPAHRGQARALALLHEGFRRQHRAGRTMARAAFDGSNDAMRRLLSRRLGAHLDAIEEVRTSRWRRPIQN